LRGGGRDLFDAAEATRLGGHRGQSEGRSIRPETVWYKIKSRTYTQDEGRWELFQKRYH
jgi:hypothetical protein